MLITNEKQTKKKMSAFEMANLYDGTKRKAAFGTVSSSFVAQRPMGGVRMEDLDAH